MKNKLLVGILILNKLVYSQTTVTLQPNAALGKDAYLNSLEPNKNYSDYKDFIAYSWTFNGSIGEGKSAIYFDISSIPKNKKIVSAKLSLYYNSATVTAGQAGNNACQLKKITSAWDENTITWNNSPTAENINSTILSKSTNSNQDYLNIDILKLFNYWYLNPNQNYGLMLELIDKNLYNSMKFCSSDADNSALLPKLEITYADSMQMDKIPKTCIDLQPGKFTGKDAYLNSLQPSINYGNYVDFITYSWTFGGNPGLGKSLLQFNLANIPKNKIVTSANLSLYYNPTSSTAGQTGNNASYLYVNTSSWQSNTVTWNTAPTYIDQNALLLPKSSSSIEDYLDINVTQQIQNWYSNSIPNYGWTLEIIDKTIYSSLKFCSSNFLDSIYAPKLNVCYKNAENISIKSIQAAADKFYLNPTSGKLNIELNNYPHTPVNAQIYNSAGKIVAKYSLSSQKNIISISEVPIGIYWFICVNNNSKHVYKFVKN